MPFYDLLAFIGGALVVTLGAAWVWDRTVELADAIALARFDQKRDPVPLKRLPGRLLSAWWMIRHYGTEEIRYPDGSWYRGAGAWYVKKRRE